MQLVNGGEFLDTMFLLALFGAVDVEVFSISIIPLRCMYASLLLHKLDLIIQVVHLM